MKLAPWRALGRNFGTLLLAFALAVVVWISAINASDPNQEQELTRTLRIENVGQDAGLLLISESTDQVHLKLEAPRSIWTQINNDTRSIRVWVDLSMLPAGTHTVPIQVDVNLRPARLVSVEPQEITITLEPLVTQTFPINLIVTGIEPTGYEAKAPTYSPTLVTISGPTSVIEQVKEVRATLDISGATESIEKELSLSARDADGNVVRGVTLSPEQISVTQKIELLGGYRNVIVKVVTEGQLASGYKLTNIFVNPASVTVFAADPKDLDELPVYIETKALDLTSASDDLEALIELDLPEGISVVGDSKVHVLVSIAPIESNLTVALQVEFTGLLPGLGAKAEPKTVDVILTGPIPALNALKPADIRVKVDLTGYEIGTYQIEPEVELLPPGVQVASVLPASVEITIAALPTATPTATLTPTVTPTPTPEGTVTVTPVGFALTPSPTITPIPYP